MDQQTRNDLEALRGELATIHRRVGLQSGQIDRYSNQAFVAGDEWVYLARAKGTDAVKVGFTSGGWPGARVPSLQTGCPHELVLEDAFAGSQRDEADLHRSLASRRIRGEWFRLTPSEVDTVASFGWWGEDPAGACGLCDEVCSVGKHGLCGSCDAVLSTEAEADMALHLIIAYAEANALGRGFAERARSLRHSKPALTASLYNFYEQYTGRTDALVADLLDFEDVRTKRWYLSRQSPWVVAR